MRDDAKYSHHIRFCLQAYCIQSPLAMYVFNDAMHAMLKWDNISERISQRMHVEVTALHIHSTYTAGGTKSHIRLNR